MIERLFSRILVAVVFVLVIADAVDTWWSEQRHHRGCTRA